MDELRPGLSSSSLESSSSSGGPLPPPEPPPLGGGFGGFLPPPPPGWRPEVGGCLLGGPFPDCELDDLLWESSGGFLLGGSLEDPCPEE